MGFLDSMRRIKKEEAKALEPDTFGARERDFFNPLTFLKDAPVIAEVKRSSPSSGKIRWVDPASWAISYQMGGAGAVSVLVDSRYFGGDWKTLKDTSYHLNIPVLCKEFILSEKQVEVAYRCGADFILFIYGFVEDPLLEDLVLYTKELGLRVLLEVFEEKQLEGALKIKGVDMIGVNSRNLQDLSVDLEKAERMLAVVPRSKFKVAESGIKSLEDAERMVLKGADALLIGEFLMRSEDPEKLLREINHVCENMRNKG